MEKEFKEIYEKIFNQYGENYKPQNTKITSKKIIYLFFTWVFISYLQPILNNLGLGKSILNLILVLISTLSMFMLIIFCILKLNHNMNYWKRAFKFKEDVGAFFWKEINENIVYNPIRTKIDMESVNNKLCNLYNNSKVIDIEESLEYEDLEMYTIKLNDENQKRLTGIFVVIENCRNKVSCEEIKELNLEIIQNIKDMCYKNNNLYLFIDAKEIFYFNSLNFLNKDELLENYNRFNDLLKIKKIIK